MDSKCPWRRQTAIFGIPEIRYLRTCRVVLGAGQGCIYCSPLPLGRINILCEGRISQEMGVARSNFMLC